MATLKETAPGIGAALLVAVVSMLASNIHPSFDPLVISIIFGMLAANLSGVRSEMERGVALVLKWAIPVGVSLYGLQLIVAGADREYWPGVLAAFALLFTSVYLMARGFGLKGTLPVLMGTGMSVCGASAIAVLAPIIRAKKEEISLALLSVMIVGLTGMIIERSAPDFIGLDGGRFAFLTGATLPMLGQVKVASSTMGAEAASHAVNIKLMRISLLILVVAAAMLAPKGPEGDKQGIPWFIVGFFGFALLGNTVEASATLREATEPLSKFALSLGLAAVGLSIDFDAVTKSGGTPLAAAAIGWGVSVTTIYLALSLMR